MRPGKPGWNKHDDPGAENQWSDEMTKSGKSSNAATHSAKDYSAAGVGYRRIGIAAVAAAVRCQQMAVPDDERGGLHSYDFLSERPT